MKKIPRVLFTRSGLWGFFIFFATQISQLQNSDFFRLHLLTSMVLNTNDRSVGHRPHRGRIKRGGAFPSAEGWLYGFYKYKVI